MTERYHRKLVRDRVPDDIRRRGETAETKILSRSEFRPALMQKLQEEALEVSSAETKDELVAELADVAEVVRTICREWDINPDEIEQKRQEFLDERGGFHGRTFLIKTK